METAEVKKKGRIRHCYPRQEVYHRWIHSPELFYSSGNSYQCFGIGDYFCTGYVDNKYTLEKFHYSEYYNISRLLAIIDRDKKEIIIYTGYNHHTYDLFRAVPDDYTIFYTDDKIPNLNILNDREELYKRHAKHLVNIFIGHYSQFYQVLDNKVKALHTNIDNFLEDDKERYGNNNIGPNYYIGKNEIISFARKYKLGKYKWYNESLGKITTYNGWNNKTDIIYPSLRKIVNNKIFNEKELIYLRQRNFYTNYCYGEGIPFVDVEKYWHKAFTPNEIKTYLRKKHISDNWNFLEGIDTWNNWIIRIVKASRQVKRFNEEENQRKSNENYKKAREEVDKLENLIQSVEDWREGKRINIKKKYVEYRTYDWRKKCWKTDKLYVNTSFKFPNVQFKLINDKILTSKNVTIEYKEGIDLFTFFIHIYKTRGLHTDFTFNNKYKKVNIYELRNIKYTLKETDTRNKLDYNTWLIQVGCHAMWLDDILDFIHYYNKEEDFGITKETTIKDFEI